MTPAQDHPLSARAVEIAQSRSHLEGPLLPILNAVQAEFGHIPREVLPGIAEVLNISRAEIYGVVSFYHDYHETPQGKHVLKVCRAEACQAAGGEVVSARILELLGLDWHQTSADGRVTVEPAYCLGLCACAPAMFVDGAPKGRLTADTVAPILREVMA